MIENLHEVRHDLARAEDRFIESQPLRALVIEAKVRSE